MVGLGFFFFHLHSRRMTRCLFWLFVTLLLRCRESTIKRGSNPHSFPRSEGEPNQNGDNSTRKKKEKKWNLKKDILRSIYLCLLGFSIPPPPPLSGTRKKKCNYFFCPVYSTPGTYIYSAGKFVPKACVIILSVLPCPISSTTE